MSQPKINLKQNIKHNRAKYGDERFMEYFSMVSHKRFFDEFLSFVKDIFRVETEIELNELKSWGPPPTNNSNRE